MPGVDYPEYKKLVIAWLRDKWGDGRRCPMCDHAVWTVLAIIDFPVRFHDMGTEFLGKSVPAVPVRCDNCGFIAVVGALHAGVLPPEPSPISTDRPKYGPPQQ